MYALTLDFDARKATVKDLLEDGELETVDLPGFLDAAVAFGDDPRRATVSPKPSAVLRPTSPATMAVWSLSRSLSRPEVPDGGSGWALSFGS